MKNLTREQIQTKLNLTQRLSEVGEELQDAISHHNQLLEAAHDEIRELEGRYNEICEEAQGFINTIKDGQEAYSNDRAEQWREEKAGEAYETWMDVWDTTLEEVEIDLPDEVENVSPYSMQAIEVLRDLPDHP